MLTRIHRSPRRLLAQAAPLALVVALLAACDVDELLDVDTPSKVPGEGLYQPANAQLLVNSALGDFECAFGAYVVASGLVTNELFDATQTADRYPYDRRDVQPQDRRYSEFGCVDLGIYTPLQTARVQAANILGFLEQWSDAEVPNRQLLIAQAAAYAGYATLLLGEGFCTTVLTQVEGADRITYGGEISRDSAFQVAITYFEQVLDAAQAAGAPAVTYENMALVGLARAHLDLGNYTEARQYAEQVPANFVQNMTASDASARRTNRVYAQNNATNVVAAVSVDTIYAQLADPRIPVINGDRTSVTGIPVWYQAKYTTDGSPIPIATYDEAQLIVAEALIESGSVPAAVDIINVYRARGNQALLDRNATTAAAATAALIDQRRREMFLEGHALGDLWRYDLTLTPAAGAAYHGSGTYGTQACTAGGKGLPLPNVERLNNPNVPDQG